MASGELGADELPRVKHKWSENSKVYTRRNSKNKNSTNNNSNSSVITFTSSPKNQSNGKDEGEKSVIIAVESNGGDKYAANGVATENSVQSNRENRVEEVPGRENIVGDVLEKENNVEEGPSNVNFESEGVEGKKNNDEDMPDAGSTIVDDVVNDANRVEEVPGSASIVEEMPDIVASVNDMPVNNGNGVELPDQENVIDEVPDKGGDVEELHNRDSGVEELHNLENGVEELQQKLGVEELQQKLPAPIEEANASQPLQYSSRVETVTLSEDSSSLNRGERPLPNGHDHDHNLANGVVREERQLVSQVDDRLSISVTAAKSKEEVRDLKRKLEDDLNQVRKMARRLEAKESQLNGVEFGGGYQEFPAVGRLQFPVNGGVENGGGVRSNLESGTVGFVEQRPFRPLTVAVMNNHHGIGEIAVAKEKRTPKANQFYRNSDFILGKDKLPTAEIHRKSKSSGGGRKRGGGEFDYGFGVDKKILKKCNDLLQKLKNHKHGWVFHKPVDVEGLRLLDYFDIIKHPMDLGTVEKRLTDNWYKTPREFAEDVRLTFHNAMTYNPEGQDVHIMAEELLKIFENKWPAIETDYERKLRYEMMRELGTPTPTSRKTYAPAHMPIHMPLPQPPLLHPAPTFQDMRNLERSQSMPVRPESRPKATYSVGRTPALKKPKAKDPHKRDMTFEEKQKLSTNLQGLPSEKLDAIVQIIKKRNSALSQNDEEIEVDIDSVDAETLWELDRFVTNYKKSLSKYKRKAEIAMQARAAAAAQAAQQTTPAAPVNTEAPREVRTDEGAAAASHPQQERHDDNGSDSSSSSSSSSDSGSSSSDSDSDSSSDSDSDGDN